MEILKIVVIAVAYLGVINCFVAEEEEREERKKEERKREENNFDPNDCYGPGTISRENEKNLGFCPCKYGYYGPTCFEIYDCVIGEIRTENCSRTILNDYDLQWRCIATSRDIIKICTCPEGFRGETCEFILENTAYSYWTTVTHSQRFFEVIYNKSDSFLKIIGTKTCKIIIEFRRLIMLIIFVVILKLAWRFTKKEQRNQRQKGPLIDQKIYSNNSKNVYLSLPKYDEVNSLEAADQFSKKTKVIEEDSISRFTQISEVSEVSENIQLKENELKFFRPHLHV